MKPVLKDWNLTSAKNSFPNWTANMDAMDTILWVLDFNQVKGSILTWIPPIFSGQFEAHMGHQQMDPAPAPKVGDDKSAKVFDPSKKEMVSHSGEATAEDADEFGENMILASSGPKSHAWVPPSFFERQAFETLEQMGLANLPTSPGFMLAYHTQTQQWHARWDGKNYAPSWGNVRSEIKALCMALIQLWTWYLAVNENDSEAKNHLQKLEAYNGEIAWWVLRSMLVNLLKTKIMFEELWKQTHTFGLSIFFLKNRTNVQYLWEHHWLSSLPNKFSGCSNWGWSVSVSWVWALSGEARTCTQWFSQKHFCVHVSEDITLKKMGKEMHHDVWLFHTCCLILRFFSVDRTCPVFCFRTVAIWMWSMLVS